MVNVTTLTGPVCLSTIQESISQAGMAQLGSGENPAHDRLLLLHSHNCLLDTVQYKKKINRKKAPSVAEAVRSLDKGAPC